MPELAYLNGDIMPIEKAMVPIEDRGYQFGDAVYEYIASYNGKLFRTEDHLQRLQRSMEIIEFPPVDIDEIRKAIITFFKKAQIRRAGLYIQISRGVARRLHAYPIGANIQFVMTISQIPESHPYLEKGASAITMKDFRWGRCDSKTVQLLPNVMAKQRALSAGLYDTIFVSEEGVVREATSSNVFIIKDGKAITHPLTRNILPGITRKVVLEICQDKGIPSEERFYSLPELYAADEVFLSGTVTEVLPIVSIDEKTIATGTVGALTLTLSRELRHRGGDN
jgi:D-alanine transaminase